jgi:hypothetical protein
MRIGGERVIDLQLGIITTLVSSGTRLVRFVTGLLSFGIFTLVSLVRIVW